MACKKVFNIELNMIDKDELLEIINSKKNYILIDVIGTWEGNTKKIKTATTIPYPTVVDRRKELLGYDDVIIYCRAYDCPASKKIALALTMLNIPNIKVYEGGIEEWTDNDLPVEPE